MNRKRFHKGDLVGHKQTGFTGQVIRKVEGARHVHYLISGQHNIFIAPAVNLTLLRRGPIAEHDTSLNPSISAKR